ncbi:hypothetical protein [Halosimplex sp. J119]
MATHTKRDRVWTAALQLASRTDEFSTADVYAETDGDDPAERTVRDVLTTMAAEEWLCKHTAPEDGRRLYSAGPKLGDAAERLSEMED